MASQDYLIGLRGLLVIQTFLFVFLQLFLPTAVVDSKNTDGPLYQIILRKTLSVLFWNKSLIYSFTILLSARTICLPYLSNPERQVCASSIFRRTLRLWIPTFIAFSIAAASFSPPNNADTTNYISAFLDITKNESTTAPLRLRNFIVYFNSLFDLFWITKNYASQAVNKAFPSNTLWIVSLLFQQSYTVYMTMIIVPYTRTSWRVKALLVFILTAFWVQSWAWYSITGLLLADAVLNMKFQGKSRRGWLVGRFRIPMWPLYVVLVVVGLILQYLFVAWRPEYRNAELKGHTGLYNSGSLNDGVDLDEPMARDDNYLIVLGTMLLIETYDSAQHVLRNRFLVGLGKRSFSIFLVQPLVLYSAGIHLYWHVSKKYLVSHEMTTLVCFITCVPTVALAAEVFYRVVDLPSVAFAKGTWVWMKS